MEKTQIKHNAIENEVFDAYRKIEEAKTTLKNNGYFVDEEIVKFSITYIWNVDINMWQTESERDDWDLNNGNNTGSGNQGGSGN
tara:strand:+ start:75 stop:326 length:252 start_codon:yes stop_codon:yes gene_type:complete